jgi:hypothetical protein
MCDDNFCKENGWIYAGSAINTSAKFNYKMRFYDKEFKIYFLMLALSFLCPKN